MSKLSVNKRLTSPQAETFHPKEWFPHVEDAHGYDGPLHIAPALPPLPIAEKMFENFKSKGLPYRPDMFSTGETPNGCGHAMRTTYEGRRTTAADYITADQERTNVTIICNATVDKVILERGADGTLEAKGAEYVDKDGNHVKVNASREVIIAGGTYCSPAILMRSGIGPKKDLEAVGVDVQVDLPGVGENLQDHQLIFMYYELKEADLTDDARVNHDPNAYENGHKEWMEKKTGWLANFPFGAFGFARLNDRLERDSEEWRNFPRREGRDPMDLTETQPNMEFFNTICYGGPPEYTDFPKEGQWAFSMCAFLCGLQSRGEVKIKSLDPFQPPYVDPRYLDDRRDLLMMSEGVRFANELVMEGAGTKDIVKGGWPPGADHHKYKTNEEWQPYVKKYTSTSYHPGGTCKLGKKDDKMAVVDQYLQVYGVKGLRVADCSVMPTLHSGHTMMPAFGIAEKAAEYILQAAHAGNATNGTKQEPLDRIDSAHKPGH
ncbi:hypothetical protein PRZ48_011177 [Zasmidium cellare]|uniref:Glucose-methanol-choline oxidoreductase N-terminal domain-containing protein n=1 Tax=Zasmidium cellare TaxID=395010 RepID=A0ABR0EAM7_ZASCE|nr:hypothetical protein PRZ48_011177 [Zasmidium cellare]